VHVAQINIGTMVAPTDDPAVAEFMDNLERINAIADEAPGFVWRLQTDSGNATDIQIFPDPLQLVNMSLWESVETLKSYVYRSEHVEFFRRRAEWFVPEAKRVALWHVTPGRFPELDDAVRRVEFQERHGASPYSFGFGRVAWRVVFEHTTRDDPQTAGFVDRHAALQDHSSGSESPIVRAVDDTGVVAVGVIRPRETDATVQILVSPGVQIPLVHAALADQLRPSIPERA
jgi:hypothetical protein